MSLTVNEHQHIETASGWFTTTDGAEHFYRRWDSTATGPCIVYIHGIESHGGWFQSTASVLALIGCTVYALDRRGSGMSPLLRGHTSSYKRLVRDVEEFINFVKASHPSSPCFVIANCWGAKLAIALAMSKQRNFDGMVLTSPAIAVKVDVSLLTKIKIGLSYLAGRKKYFGIPLTSQHFTDQTAYLQFINEDPLRLKQATAAFFVENVKLSLLCRRAPARLTMPLLILQSGRDAIVNVNDVERWFHQVAARDKKMQIFPDATHSLDFDREVKTYQTVLCNWILDHAGHKK